MHMQYDSTGTSPDNKVTLETVDLTNSVSIQPIEGAFFKKDFLVTGINTDDTNSVRVPLTAVNDFLYSPLFLSESLNVKQEIYSFIVILNPLAWTAIEINYQALGAIDTVLADERTQLITFDPLNASDWLGLLGELSGARLAHANPILHGNDSLEIFSEQLYAIIDSLKETSTSVLDDAVGRNAASNVAQNTHLAHLTSVTAKRTQLLAALITLGTDVNTINDSFEPLNGQQDMVIQQNTDALPTIPPPNTSALLDTFTADIQANAVKSDLQAITIDANTVANSLQDDRLDTLEGLVADLELVVLAIDTTALDAAIKLHKDSLGDQTQTTTVIGKEQLNLVRDGEQTGLIAQQKIHIQGLQSAGGAVDLTDVTQTIADHTVEIAALKTATLLNTTNNTQQNITNTSHRAQISSLLDSVVQFDEGPLLADIQVQSDAVVTNDTKWRNVRILNSLQDNRLDLLDAALLKLQSQPTGDIAPYQARITVNSNNIASNDTLIVPQHDQQVQQDQAIADNTSDIDALETAAPPTTLDLTDITASIDANDALLLALQTDIDTNTETIVVQNSSIDALVEKNNNQDTQLALSELAVYCGASLLVPEENAIVHTGTPVLVSTSYRGLTDTDAHTRTEWAIAMDISFNTLFFHRESDVPEVTTQVSTNLPIGTYYGRVRHISSESGIPAWGKVTVFTIDQTDCLYTPYDGVTLTASDASEGDQFGTAVTLNNTGTLLAVGANGFDGDSENEGKVYLYSLIDAGVTANEPWSIKQELHYPITVLSNTP